jgi:hypothetical protein
MFELFTTVTIKYKTSLQFTDVQQDLTKIKH